MLAVQKGPENGNDIPGIAGGQAKVALTPSEELGSGRLTCW